MFLPFFSFLLLKPQPIKQSITNSIRKRSSEWSSPAGLSMPRNWPNSRNLRFCCKLLNIGLEPFTAPLQEKQWQCHRRASPRELWDFPSLQYNPTLTSTLLIHEAADMTCQHWIQWRWTPLPWAKSPLVSPCPCYEIYSCNIPTPPANDFSRRILVAALTLQPLLSPLLSLSSSDCSCVFILVRISTCKFSPSVCLDPGSGLPHAVVQA